MVVDVEATHIGHVCVLFKALETALDVLWNATRLCLMPVCTFPLVTLEPTEQQYDAVPCRTD